MKDAVSALDNPVLRALLLFAALMIIGFATRFPALQFPQFYALHGVLAAPFFSAIARWHFNRNGGVGGLFAATLVLAGALGMMSAVMGMSFLLLAACLLVVYGLTRGIRPVRRSLVCAVVFGALDYPCALAAGIMLNSYAFSPGSVPTILLLAALAVGLSLLGALLVTKDERKASAHPRAGRP